MDIFEMTNCEIQIYIFDIWLDFQRFLVFVNPKMIQIYCKSRRIQIDLDRLHSLA